MRLIIAAQGGVRSIVGSLAMFRLKLESGK